MGRGTCSGRTIESFGDSTVCCDVTLGDLAAEVVDGLLERCYGHCGGLFDDFGCFGHSERVHEGHLW